MFNQYALTHELRRELTDLINSKRRGEKLDRKIGIRSRLVSAKWYLIHAASALGRNHEITRLLVECGLDPISIFNPVMYGCEMEGRGPRETRVADDLETEIDQLLDDCRPINLGDAPISLALVVGVILREYLEHLRSKLETSEPHRDHPPFVNLVKGVGCAYAALCRLAPGLPGDCEAKSWFDEHLQQREAHLRTTQGTARRALRRTRRLSRAHTTHDS